MARKRQLNTVRTDYLENWIGFFRAHKFRSKADALCKVARDIGAPIDFEEVERLEELHKATQLKLFTGWDDRRATPV